ncbi:hypothetical protein CC80DRAFT_558626 [Byssothecium circinans]|uniref:Uncharacterized protein n=1 Tax=Byssothecium circinans TaxID=147558 RepID=A0A6A5U2C3_9PLEO|nr:hypothetical protein CC80DRAFT_558626 [Byssothecium circinans]
MRTKDAAMGTATNWLSNLMVVEITPPVYFFYPETAGRSLEDLDRFFGSDHCPLLVFRDKEAIAEKRPEQFVQREQEETRRNSGVVPGGAAAAQEKYEREKYRDSV